MGEEEERNKLLKELSFFSDLLKAHEKATRSSETEASKPSTTTLISKQHQNPFSTSKPTKLLTKPGPYTWRKDSAKQLTVSNKVLKKDQVPTEKIITSQSYAKRNSNQSHSKVNEVKIQAKLATNYDQKGVYPERSSQTFKKINNPKVPYKPYVKQHFSQNLLKSSQKEPFSQHRIVHQNTLTKSASFPVISASSNTKISTQSQKQYPQNEGSPSKYKWTNKTLENETKLSEKNPALKSNLQQMSSSSTGIQNEILVSKLSKTESLRPLEKVTKHKLVRSPTKRPVSEKPFLAVKLERNVSSKTEATTNDQNKSSIYKLDRKKKKVPTETASPTNKYKFVRQKSPHQTFISKYKVVHGSTENEADTTVPKSSQIKTPLSSSKSLTSLNRAPFLLKHSTASWQHQLSKYYVQRAHKLNRLKLQRQLSSENSLKDKKAILWKSKYSLKKDNSECMSINQLLGRKVNNTSSSRFKYIKDNQPVSQKSNIKKTKSSYKIDRREKSPEKIRKTSKKRRSLRTVNINGILYFSSKNTLVKHSQNPKRRSLSGRQSKFSRNVSSRYHFQRPGFKTYGSSTKQWKRSFQQGLYKSTGSSFKWIKPVTQGSRTWSRNQKSAAVKIASHYIQKSIISKTSATWKRNQTKDGKKSCLFYNRFGKCKRGSQCPYVHDPDKVAVCTRFLRGTCKVTNCPFSHKVSVEKMPVCIHFLRGTCNRDNCPYLHVNVGKDAVVCQDFIKGYCPLAEKCKKQHILNCPEWTQTGQCSKNKKCGMRHGPLKTGKRKLLQKLDDVETGEDKQLTVEGVQVSPAKQPLLDNKETTTEDFSKRSILPAFISLSGSAETTPQVSKQEKSKDTGALHIHPKL